MLLYSPAKICLSPQCCSPPDLINSTYPFPSPCSFLYHTCSIYMFTLLVWFYYNKWVSWQHHMSKSFAEIFCWRIDRTLLFKMLHLAVLPPITQYLLSLVSGLSCHSCFCLQPGMALGNTRVAWIWFIAVSSAARPISYSRCRWQSEIPF